LSKLWNFGGRGFEPPKHHLRYATVWWRNLRERDYLGDPGVDGKIILRRIFRKWNVRVWTGLSWLRIGTVGGHL
jgi:hypothetical protein